MDQKSLQKDIDELGAAVVRLDAELGKAIGILVDLSTISCEISSDVYERLCRLENDGKEL